MLGSVETVEYSRDTTRSSGTEALPTNIDAPIAFRNYILFPSARVLLRGDVVVEIGARAFDLLTVLSRARGHILSREDIFRYVWPTTTVDESNLRFQVGMLRRALGSDRDLIKTITGRGYMCVVDISNSVSMEAERTGPTASSLGVDKNMQGLLNPDRDRPDPRHTIAPSSARMRQLSDENVRLRRALEELVRDTSTSPQNAALKQADDDRPEASTFS